MSDREINIEQNEDAIVDRADDLLAAAETAKPAFNVKPRIPKMPEISRPEPVTTPGEDVIKAAEKQQEAFRINAVTAGSKIVEGVAKLENLNVSTRDFSDMTEDDVYDLSIPMTARPFSSEDSL